MFDSISGIFWQFTWRFAAPILLAGILAASVVFELTSSPTYSIWNKETVGTNDHTDPEVSMGFL